MTKKTARPRQRNPLLPSPRCARVRLAFLALALLLLSGCVERSSPVEVSPFYVLNDVQPGRVSEFALQLRSLSTFRQELPVRVEGPAGWNLTAETGTAQLRGHDTGSLVVRITPAADAPHAPQTVSVFVGDTRADVLVNVRDLGRMPLREGIGAQLYYVLFAPNGTLLSTNDPAIRAREALGAALLDANDTSGDVPLKVYVGGRRGEDPPEPYNSTGYRPVITGFDARLRDAGDGRGMVAGDTLAVRIPKEQAYTVPGNEDHALYGQDLSFLIRVVTVDELVARTCGLPVCPDTPRQGADP